MSNSHDHRTRHDRRSLSRSPRVAWLAAVAFGGILVAGCGSAATTRVPAAAANPDVVAVFLGDVLTLEEFERRYAQTVGSRELAANDSLAAYEDFLERYVDFRLKVRAAEEAGIPALSEISEELRGYRSSLARPYLLEREVVEPIVRRLYERRQEFVDVSHILVRVDPDAFPADTVEAFRFLSAIRDSALQGVDFGDLAFRHSEDPSARGPAANLGHRGRLGYFTAGRMVEPFETHSYETAVGDVSPVFRTQFGYHILYVHDRIDAIADVRLSHIMLRPQPGEEDRARETLEGILERVRAGEDFSTLASQYSEDAQSRPLGGDVGFISFDAPIDRTFKDPAFALREIGDVSDVVETPYGMHVIQLTDRREPQSFEEAYPELKQLSAQLPSMREAEKVFARQVVLEHGARIDTTGFLSVFETMPADSVFPRLVQKRLLEGVLQREIFVIGDSSFALRDVGDYAVTASHARVGDARTRAMNVLSEYITDRAIEFEAARLEERDPEFRRIMQEFRDGLVLFKFMEDHVWNAAERDTAALQAHFDAFRDTYWWPERTRVITIQSPSDSLAQVVAAHLDDGEPVADVFASYANDAIVAVRLDTMMLAGVTNSIYDRALELEPGTHTAPLSYRDGFAILINDGVEPPRPKTFDEARTQVVSEYQEKLERRLLDELRHRHDVHTFPERLGNAYFTRGETASASGE